MHANLLPLLLLATNLSHAESAISVGELSAVQSQTYLYKAQGERAKALRALESEGGTPSGTVTSGNSELPPPVIKLVYGPPQALRATLLYSAGYEVEARVGGPELPGGYSVSSISLDSVALSRAGKRYPLGFASTAPTQKDTGIGIPSQPMGLPGMLPGQPAPVFQP